MRDYRVTAPPRVDAVGFGPGAGGSRLPAYQGSPWRPIGGPSSSTSGNPISDAIAGALSSAETSLQVALGALLIGTALLIVLAQTSAAQTAGRAGVGVARRGARFIPGVGALA